MLFWNRWNQESAGRVYFNISREKPAHTPDTPHVQPLSCKLEWTNQKHFYCFLLKPIRDNLAPGFPRALDLSPLHEQKSSGSRLAPQPSCAEVSAEDLWGRVEITLDGGSTEEAIEDSNGCLPLFFLPSYCSIRSWRDRCSQGSKFSDFFCTKFTR